MSISLGQNHHGKGRVRVVKVKRTPEKHYIQQILAEILIEGDTETAFLTSSNAAVLPTDTVKNTVSCLAKLHEFDSIEDFAVILGKHFVTRHPKLISKATVTLFEDQWIRLSTPDSRGVVKEHHHAFVKGGTEKNYTRVIATRPTHGGEVQVQIFSGFKDLTLLKTSQSSFSGFYKDEYTSLPEVSDRLVGTNMSAEWTYGSLGSGICFNKLRANIRQSVLDTFAGPSDVGTPSPSVQYTLYKIGEYALQRNSEIKDIKLHMPNVHNIPVDLTRYGIKQDHPHGEIFLPIDEPHGIIEATITRKNNSRL